jgi:hypothetical protein
MPGRFRLRFSARQIPAWAARYEYGGDDETQERVADAIRLKGWLDKPTLLAVCEWKSPRTQKHCRQNPPGFVKTVTRAAFATSDERFRIEALTLLDGVSWPTASVLLHFGVPNRYPILDYRALWSLGVEPPRAYDFGFWWAYATHCRALARRQRLSMRTLDRALWQYSKENQP